MATRNRLFTPFSGGRHVRGGAGLVLEEAPTAGVGDHLGAVPGVLHARLRRVGDDAGVVIDRVPDGARLLLDGQELPTTGRGTITVDVPAGPAHDLELAP
ncbi:hypothetical protein GCM10023201_44000 [Actinomycetospora corticicola]